MQKEANLKAVMQTNQTLISLDCFLNMKLNSQNFKSAKMFCSCGSIKSIESCKRKRKIFCLLKNALSKYKCDCASVSLNQSDSLFHAMLSTKHFQCVQRPRKNRIPLHTLFCLTFFPYFDLNLSCITLAHEANPFW